MPPPGMGMGHVRHPQKDHLMQLSARRHPQLMQTLLEETPPSLWDSRTMGYVGPVKSQASCGSCWDFSGTGMVEIAYYAAGVFPPDGSHSLSEQYTLDCGRNGGCSGDDNVTVLQEAKQNGLPKTADYGPYQGRSTKCHFQNTWTLYKIDDWGFVDGSQGRGITDTDLIKAAIMKYGCVGCACDGSFPDPGKGVISGRGGGINHDVILVGWDDSKNAWILRNSWDKKWGDQGYAYIEYKAYSIGTEAVWCYVNPQAPPIWYP